MVRIHPDPPHQVTEARDREPTNGQGAVAQLGERLLCKQEAVGSIPSSSTTSGDRGQGTGHRRNGLGTTYRLRHGTAVNAFDLTKVSGVEGCRSLTIREGKAHSGLMRVRMRGLSCILLVHRHKRRCASGANTLVTVVLVTGFTVMGSSD